MKTLLLLSSLAAFASCSSSRYATYVQPGEVEKIDTLPNGLLYVHIKNTGKPMPLADTALRAGMPVGKMVRIKQ